MVSLIGIDMTVLNDVGMMLPKRSGKLSNDFHWLGVMAATMLA